MSFYLYLVSSDESATLLNEPLLTLQEKPTEMTDDLIKQIVRKCYEINDTALPDNFDAMTANEALEDMRDNECLYASENTVIVVEGDEKTVKGLEVVGDAIAKTMGDDSSCYAAVAVWYSVLQSNALDEGGEFEI